MKNSSVDNKIFTEYFINWIWLVVESVFVDLLALCFTILKRDTWRCSKNCLYYMMIFVKLFMNCNITFHSSTPITYLENSQITPADTDMKNIQRSRISSPTNTSRAKIAPPISHHIPPPKKNHSPRNRATPVPMIHRHTLSDAVLLGLLHNKAGEFIFSGLEFIQLSPLLVW